MSQYLFLHDLLGGIILGQDFGDLFFHEAPRHVRPRPYQQAPLLAGTKRLSVIADLLLLDGVCRTRKAELMLDQGRALDEMGAFQFLRTNRALNHKIDWDTLGVLGGGRRDGPTLGGGASHPCI